MLQRQVIVVDREDLVFRPIHQQQPRTPRLVQRPVIKQTKLMSIFLKRLEIEPISPFVGERRRQVEWIFQVVDMIQPLRVKHMVASTPQRHHPGEAVWMGVREPDPIIAACTKRPHRDPFAVHALLLLHPVQQARPLAIRGLGVVFQGGGVAGSGDFDDDAGDAVAPPAFHPDGELGAVAVEAGHDDEKRDWARGAGGVGKEVEDGDVGPFALDGVGVRDEYFVDGVFAESETCVNIKSSGTQLF